MPLFFSCKTNFSVLTADTQLSDTLAKYTYLIIGVKKNKDRPGSKEIGTSSGFFLLNSDNKLFLVTAHHVFTGCSLFSPRDTTDTARLIIPDTLKVWYMDRSGHYKDQPLSVAAYKNRPCSAGSARADLDTMDVTAYFKDGNIFSIEGMVSHNKQKNPVAKIGDTVVCYGFSKDGPKKIPPAKGDPQVIASKLTSQVIAIPAGNELNSYDSIYTAIYPAYKDGYSGAPIFKISFVDNKKGTVEFAGVQSGNSSDNSSFSIFVKGNTMNWGKFFSENSTALHR
jgi:hypothetical protein